MNNYYKAAIDLFFCDETKIIETSYEYNKIELLRRETNYSVKWFEIDDFGNEIPIEDMTEYEELHQKRKDE